MATKLKQRHPSSPGRCGCGFETHSLDAAREHYRETGHKTWKVPTRWLREAGAWSFGAVFGQREGG